MVKFTFNNPYICNLHAIVVLRHPIFDITVAKTVVPFYIATYYKFPENFGLSPHVYIIVWLENPTRDNLSRNELSL